VAVVDTSLKRVRSNERLGSDKGIFKILKQIYLSGGKNQTVAMAVRCLKQSEGETCCRCGN
jgi:hypothetical protein